MEIREGINRVLLPDAAAHTDVPPPWIDATDKKTRLHHIVEKNSKKYDLDDDGFK